VIELLISGEIREVIPEVRLGCIRAAVEVLPSTVDLLGYIDEVGNKLKDNLHVEEVSKIEIIADTKYAYRQLGKDPSRYRPSAEALTRRIVQGKGLYQVNNIVDALNIISIKHGFSIGGYDLDLVDGMMELDIGCKGETYEAIGRGPLNIEHLPVLRDGKGAFGSPTSDSKRTMIRSESRNFLMVFFDFSGSVRLQEAMDDAVALYRDFCDVQEIETIIY
jgi:DNA/RNA-binding domain of Phe-tRNA-synthetase-like protein